MYLIDDYVLIFASTYTVQSCKRSILRMIIIVFIE